MEKPHKGSKIVKDTMRAQKYSGAVFETPHPNIPGISIELDSMRSFVCVNRGDSMASLEGLH
jgi:hypothetical protein